MGGKLIFRRYYIVDWSEHRRHNDAAADEPLSFGDYSVCRQTRVCVIFFMFTDRTVTAREFKYLIATNHTQCEIGIINIHCGATYCRAINAENNREQWRSVKRDTHARMQLIITRMLCVWGIM